MPGFRVLLLLAILPPALAAASPLLAASAPILEARAFGTTIADPGAPFTIAASVRNDGAVDARAVTARISGEGVTVWRNLPPFCTIDGAGVTCAVGDVAAHNVVRFDLQAIAPDEPSGAGFLLTIVATDSAGNTASGASTVRMYRTFYAINTAGSGPGSLASALDEAGRACGSECKVAFRIAAPAAGAVTIRPTLPLRVSGGVILDGRSQTQFGGDTNPHGPEIEINGALAADGAPGLVVQSGSIAGLAVNGFSGPGIRVDGSAYIEGNYIGCDPAGTLAVPNERGIVLQNPARSSTVTGNVISGNRRGGVFAWSGVNVRVDRNRIGLAARGDAPLPNGASGVFMGPEVAGAYVNANSIAFNAHAGISVAAGIREVEMRANSLHANASLGIDYVLDGVSPSVAGTSAVVNIPEITSARYDAASDRTTIEGLQRAAKDGFATRSVTLYANDDRDPSGFGEGQYPLGEHPFASFDSGPDPAFRITLKGRPPGRWITATVTVTWHYYWSRTPRPDGNNEGLHTTTSEFGRAVAIEGY